MRTTAFLLLLALGGAAQAAAGAESFQGALARPGEVHPSQYSFADLYRLAAAGPSAGLTVVAASEATIRTATGQPGVQFSISEAPEPQLGVLLLSGVALALWVARRRLGYAY